MSYAVGYRRPPPESQFKKGTSGNPKGRPKGSRNVQTLLEQHLRRRVVVNEGGKKKSVTRLEAIVMRLVTQAVQGDFKQLQLLLSQLPKGDAADAGGLEDLLPAGFETALEDYVTRQGLVSAPEEDPPAMPVRPGGVPK